MPKKELIADGPEWSPKQAARELRLIPINIWDDYHDDGLIPKGEIQETHVYVESSILSIGLRNDVLREFIHVIKKLSPSKKTLFSFAESIGRFRTGEFKIRIKHLTHADRIKLLRRLKKAKPKYMGVPLDIYSES